MSGFSSESTLLVLSLALSANAQSPYGYGYGNHRSLAGGGIAGIVIGSLVFLVFLCICFFVCLRRRRAARLSAPTTSVPFGFCGGRYGLGGNTAPQAEYREAGYGGGPPQAGWNDGPQGGNFNERYAPRAGAPPPAPPYSNSYGANPVYTPQPAGEYAPPPGPPPPAHSKW